MAVLKERGAACALVRMVLAAPETGAVVGRAAAEVVEQVVDDALAAVLPHLRFVHYRLRMSPRSSISSCLTHGWHRHTSVPAVDEAHIVAHAHGMFTSCFALLLCLKMGTSESSIPSIFALSAPAQCSTQCTVSPYFHMLNTHPRGCTFAIAHASTVCRPPGSDSFLDPLILVCIRL